VSSARIGLVAVDCAKKLVGGGHWPRGLCLGRVSWEGHHRWQRPKPRTQVRGPWFNWLRGALRQTGVHQSWSCWAEAMVGGLFTPSVPSAVVTSRYAGV